VTPAPAEDAAAAILDAPVTAVKGVGPRRAKLLERLGAGTIGELIALQPRRVERRGPVVGLAELEEHLGGFVHVRAKVVGTRVLRRGRRSILRVGLMDDSSSAKRDAVYFNQNYLVDRFETGRELYLYGRVVKAPGIALAAPRVVRDDDPPPGALELVYPLTAGISATQLRVFVDAALGLAAPELVESLDDAVLERLDLPDLSTAYHETHRPSSIPDLKRGLRRLRLESALVVQARLADQRRSRADGDAPRLRSDRALMDEVAAQLPFAPTRAQRRVWGELAHDLARAAPMRRLLQGDVGSGKTVCALFAATVAARGGAQCALLAPTEVLAEQHYATERERMENLGVRTALLTGSMRAKERRAVRERLAAGEIDQVFGTHALLSDEVTFANLGVAIVDEQHRFGVLQRERLFAKGRDVHQLLVTATPIPRTLARTLWADLDVSVIDELPPGRAPVRTHVLGYDDFDAVAKHVHGRLERGERAFWIAPRIESSAAGRGAEEIAHALSKTPLGAFGVELVHGSLAAPERAKRLARFRDGDARLVVGTTVLEVGIDVPAATAIVVEGADRLGIAQLHQLRGRVGRGGGDAWCFLLVGSDPARERIAWLAEESDGFAVAERDLERRGMGDLLGARQAGANGEGLGDGEPDLELWLAARDLVATRPDIAARYLTRARTADEA